MLRFPIPPESALGALLLFTNTVGGPIRHTRFSEAWHPAARGAGLAEGVGMQALRHFFASSLIAPGCSVVSVQERLGHATATETLNTYAHLWPDDEDRTREAVDAVLGTSRFTSRGSLGVSPGRGVGDGESTCRRGSVPRTLAGIRFGDHPSVRPT